MAVQLSDEEVAGLVHNLVSNGHIAIAGSKVTYALPALG
jgi:hypothetical protein